MKTKQEIFDTVWKHMETQKERSIVPTRGNNKPICSYRDEKGNSCAIGCLIDDKTAEFFDDLYFQKENANIKAIMMHYENMVPAYFHENRLLMIKLQLAHDEADTYEAWKENMSKLADKENLQMPDMVA